MVSLLIAVIVAALIFDFINGFHDAANAIATSVSTGVLPVRTAVFMAAVFNFVGALTGVKVTQTIAKDFADPAIVTQTVILSALIGASAWNLLTWWRGMPSSSSHALNAAIMGVGASKRLSAVRWGVAGNMLVAWVMTIPLSAAFAFVSLLILRPLFG